MNEWVGERVTADDAVGLCCKQDLILLSGPRSSQSGRRAHDSLVEVQGSRSRQEGRDLCVGMNHDDDDSLVVGTVLYFEMRLPFPFPFLFPASHMAVARVPSLTTTFEKRSSATPGSTR